MMDSFQILQKLALLEELDKERNIFYRLCKLTNDCLTKNKKIIAQKLKCLFC